jgi:hypothetical protein
LARHVLIDACSNANAGRVLVKGGDVLDKALPTFPIDKDLKGTDALPDLVGVEDDCIVSKVRELDAREGGNFACEIVVNFEEPAAQDKHRKGGVYVGKPWSPLSSK